MKKLIILLMSFLVIAGITSCNDLEPIPPTPPTPPVVKKMGNTYIVYQANEKIFAKSASFQAIDNRLDEIAALGINVLWLMPIHPVGIEKTANSPYCVRDFKGIKSEFGTMDDLKNLVNHAHAKDMKVILDWIANHSALDHPWISQHPDWYGTASGDELNWKDVQPFNFNNKDMRAAMIDAMTYWVREANIDGFRCDYAQGCPDSFWKEAIDSIRAINPEAIMLAETSRLELFQAGFDWMYSWSYLAQVQKVTNSGNLAGLYSASDKELESTPAGKQRLRYVTNHDACSEKANQDCYKSPQGMLAASCLTYFLGGIPLIYSSQEIGYMQRINFCCTSDKSVIMNWNSNPDVLTAYKQLMKAYAESAELRGGTIAHKENTPGVATITYTGTAGTLLVLVNTNNSEQTVSVPISLLGEQMKDLLTGQTQRLTQGSKLAAYEYRILGLEK